MLLFVPQVTLVCCGRSAEGTIKVTGVRAEERRRVETVSQAVLPVSVQNGDI